MPTPPLGETGRLSWSVGKPAGCSVPTPLEAVQDRRSLGVRCVPVVTRRWCAAGPLGPVVHMCAGKAREDIAFAVPMWARGYYSETQATEAGSCAVFRPLSPLIRQASGPGSRCIIGDTTFIVETLPDSTLVTTPAAIKWVQTRRRFTANLGSNQIDILRLHSLLYLPGSERSPAVALAELVLPLF